MFRLAADITIGDVRVTWADKLRIESSWESLTDTCVFTIPNKVKDQSGEWREVFGREKLINHGDEVRVELGYYPNMRKEFTGFVKRIKPDYPLTIECEDESYILKRENVNETFEDISLSGLLQQISPIPFETNASVQLGTLRLKNVTVHQLLTETLRDTYGLVSFIRDGTLMVGVPYAGKSNEFDYTWGHNIISDQLKWQRKDEIRYKVKAISPQSDGSKIETEVGDEGGTVRTFFKYDVGKATLKKGAEEFLERVKYTGFTGSFMTFGLPQVKHGDAVNIQHRLKERRGKYKVKRVVTTYGTNGYRRKIEPERDAA